jgi:hypothetical protein
MVTLCRFLADQQNIPIIDLQAARLDICRTCITYLGFECFSYEADEEIEQAILSGEFVFFHYAATQWITQLKLYVKNLTNKTESNPLCEEVEDLVQRMESYDQIAISQVGQPKNQDFSSIEGDWPDLSKVLSRENAFLMFKAPFTSLKTGIQDPSTPIPFC